MRISCAAMGNHDAAARFSLSQIFLVLPTIRTIEEGNDVGSGGSPRTQLFFFFFFFFASYSSQTVPTSVFLFLRFFNRWFGFINRHPKWTGRQWRRQLRLSLLLFSRRNRPPFLRVL